MLVSAPLWAGSVFDPRAQTERAADRRYIGANNRAGSPEYRTWDFVLAPRVDLVGGRRHKPLDVYDHQRNRGRESIH